MTTTRQVLDAVTARIAAAGLGKYDPDGIYAPTDTGIVWKVMPPAPDRVIVLNVYGDTTSPDPALPGHLWRVQVRTRTPGHPADVDDLADALHTALTAHRQTWGHLHVARCQRISYGQMGADANRRQERSDNYELITH